MLEARYIRQIVLKELGIEGQERLAEARVLIVGLGGLGSPAALYLAAAGIGTLGLVDHDGVDISNLQRQILYKTGDQGQSKALCAQQRLLELNPELRLKVYVERFDMRNALEIAGDYDVLIDGTDNFAGKFLLNDVSVKLGKPLVYGSILRWEGQLAVFWAAHGPCYRCLFPHPPEADIPNCAEAGVVGALAGTIGSLQALEAIKLIIAREPPYAGELRPAIGRLWLLRAATLESQSLRIPKNPSCLVCSLPAEQIEIREAASPGCAWSAFEEYGAHELLEDERWKNFICIDVREDEEWARGHMPGAIHWPLSSIIGQKPLPELHGQGPILLYCQGGARSRKAYQLLIERGFRVAGHMRDGFAAWRGPIG